MENNYQQNDELARTNGAPSNEQPQQQPVWQGTAPTVKTKYCKHCGSLIPEDAVLCTACGRQVEELKYSQQPSAAQPNIYINNQNTNQNVNQNMNYPPAPYYGNPKNKWVAFILCLFLGAIGIHKFYEGKVGMGILYIFTVGLFGIGWLIDLIAILLKPTTYYV